MVLIKVEDRDQFGQGNRSRGIAIAQSLSRIRVPYCIISSTKQWFGYLQSEKFQAVLIEEGYDSVAEVKAVSELFKSVEIHFMVLDGDRFNPDYVELLKKHNIRSVILDDVARVNRENAWALINANIYANDDLYKCWNIKKYLGKRYLLLRQPFLNPNQDAPVKNQILIALGVMMGQQGTNEIESRLKQNGYTTQVAAGFSPEQMVKAIDSANLIICGASVTLHEVWTRHRLALPVYQANDQILFHEFLKNNNLPQVVSIGRNESEIINEIIKLAEQTINSSLPQIQLTNSDIDELFKELIADVA